MPDAVPTVPQVLAIKLDGCEAVRLDDLPIDVFTQIATKHGMSWVGLKNGPAADPQALADLIEHVAAMNGVDVPSRPVTVRDATRQMNDILVWVDDDMPEEWEGEENGPQFPPEAGVTETET